MTAKVEFNHEKKIHPEPFRAIVAGRKTFEVRKFEEPWREGDTLLLREWDPDLYAVTCQRLKTTAKPQRGEHESRTFLRARASAKAYTGQQIAVEVCYVVAPGTWGLPEEIVVFGIKPLGAPAVSVGTWSGPKVPA